MMLANAWHNIVRNNDIMPLPDTLANIAGVFVLTIWGVFSFKTRCFVRRINIFNKFKNKKDNEK